MNKKILWGILIILLIIGAALCLWKYKQNKQEETEEFTEYTPQEEISQEQERQTLVTLYFVNKETKMLMPEARLIDAKLLAQNPYATLIRIIIKWS